MIKTWRWFGKKDIITLDMLRQIGVEGIVTALYDVPPGEEWSTDAIHGLKGHIEHAGLRWLVAESLPVPEEIKWGDPDSDRLIECYRNSLLRLGKAGVTTVCYNFMPAIDWVRTDLRHRLPDGSYTLYFDKTAYVCFDCYILCREGAEQDYTEEELDRARSLYQRMNSEEREELIDTIIVKTQGFIHRKIGKGNEDPLDAFRTLLQRYNEIDKEQLRANLSYFLRKLVPTAEEAGVTLCIHPDDPPFPVFGLPRIVCNEGDLEQIMEMVDSPANGITLCAGSLSASSENNLPALAEKFADRIGFAHLRSTSVFPNGNFVEASHLEGNGRLLDVVRILESKSPDIPMRVDHGRLMLDDVNKTHNPGYSFCGRMFALAQLEGMMSVVRDEIRREMFPFHPPEDTGLST